MGAVLYIQNSQASCDWLTLFFRVRWTKESIALVSVLPDLESLRDDARTKLLTLSGADPWYGSSYELALTAQKSVKMEGFIPSLFQVQGRFFPLTLAGSGSCWSCSRSPKSLQTGNRWSQRCDPVCVL